MYEYLGELGWTPMRTRLASQLGENGIPVPPHTDGQHSLGDNYYSAAVKQ